MEPRRPARNELQSHGWHAKRRKKSKRICLGIEEVDAGMRHRPIPSAPPYLCRSAANRACGHLLPVFGIAVENLPDLEQRHIAESPVGVALRRCDQSRQ